MRIGYSVHMHITAVNRQMAVMAVAEDLAARYAAHKLSHISTGPTGRHGATYSCSCRWSSGIVSEDMRPQWAAIDRHMVDDVLPCWEQGVCWCGRVILLGPFGRWIHAQDACMGHDAQPTRPGHGEEAPDGW
jgi:hypothetical protein